VTATTATCLTLSRHVLDFLRDPRDLVALAEACPQLLATPCARRLAQLGAAAPNASSLFAAACGLGKLDLAQSEAQRLGKDRARLLVSRDDYRLFRVACQSGNTPVAVWLADTFAIDKRAALARNGWAFWMACARGKLDTARWLASRYGIMPAEVRADGNRAFCEALSAGFVDVATWLATTFRLTRNDVRARNNSALIAVCATGKLAAAKWLFHTFGLTAADARADNCTALASACLNGHADVAVWLLSTEVGLTLEDARAGTGLALQAAMSTLHVTRAIEAALGVRLAAIARADSAERERARPPATQLSPVVARRVDQMVLGRGTRFLHHQQQQHCGVEVEPVQCGWAYN